MSRWFRVYDDLVNDPKVQLLSPETFKVLVNCWCLSSQFGGHLPDIKIIAFKNHMRVDRAERIVVELVERGLIDKTEQGYTPHNWHVRQYKSDVSNERVKRHREQKRNVTVTPPDNTDTETDTEEQAKACSDAQARKAFDFYNLMADTHGFSRATKLNSQRMGKLKARLKDCGGMIGWDAALKRLAASSYCRGEANGFKADLDFLLQETSFIRLMEGRYDDRQSKPKPNSFAEGFAKVDAVIDELRRRENGTSEAAGSEDAFSVPRLRQGSG